MAAHTPKNERIKHQYFAYLKEAARYSEASVDADEAVKFAWDRLHEEKRVVGPVLGPPLDSGPPRAYQPMQREHATLFRTFADLNYQDKEALLGFAMKFGLLGVETRTQSIPTPGRTGEDRYHHARGECA